jgi:hypothetical protein
MLLVSTTVAAFKPSMVKFSGVPLMLTVRPELSFKVEEVKSLIAECALMNAFNFGAEFLKLSSVS